MVWNFIGVYIMNRTLHGRLETARPRNSLHILLLRPQAAHTHCACQQVCIADRQKWIGTGNDGIRPRGVVKYVIFQINISLPLHPCLFICPGSFSTRISCFSSSLTQLFFHGIVAFLVTWVFETTCSMNTSDVRLIQSFHITKICLFVWVFQGV